MTLYKTAFNNWPLVHDAGEFLRARLGFTDTAYLEWVLETQKHHFTPFGMFMERGAPLAYDGFGRYFTTGILQRGYHGTAYDFYREMSWRGAMTSLLIQSPFGEMPTGYRSAHHLWNENQLAVVYEIYAAQYAKAGKLAHAGAFKRAAHLALQTTQRWIRPEGSGYVTKNRFPIQAQWKVANPFSTYNLLSCSMLAAAYTYADETIAEHPAPADVGGFVVQIPEFNMVVANSHGNYVQYLTRGNFKHNPTGLLRLHLRGGNPQLGPSDGAVAFPTANVENDPPLRAFSVGPAWKDIGGTEIRLSEFPALEKFDPSETHPALPPQAQITILGQTDKAVGFRASYDWNGAQISETLRLDKSGLTVTDEVLGPAVHALRVYFPGPGV